MHPATIDWAIMGVYFALVLAVGYTLRYGMAASGVVLAVAFLLLPWRARSRA